MNRELGIAFLVLALAACTAKERHPHRNLAGPCVTEVDGASASCSVSAMHLVVTGADWEGKVVLVSLYYPGYDSSLMFASQEAADIHDVSAAFVFDRSAKITSKGSMSGSSLSPGYYRVRARFHQIEPLIVGEGVVVPLVVAGSLVDITSLERIRTVNETRANCAKLPGCKMNYLHGFYPIPTLIQESDAGNHAIKSPPHDRRAAGK